MRRSVVIFCFGVTFFVTVPALIYAIYIQGEIAATSSCIATMHP